MLTLKDQGSQNGFLCFWAGHCECILFLEFFKLFVVVDMETFHVAFGFMVQELWGFKDFSLASGRLSATVNAANSAQNCQNLPKDETLKFHQKSRF
jgi:hypothetical protein